MVNNQEFSPKKNIMTLFWFTLFVDFFVNSDWLELVVFFYTNEQDGEETPSLSTLRTTAIYDKVLRQDCATFEIEKYLEERLKATEMFFSKATMSLFLYQLTV